MAKAKKKLKRKSMDAANPSRLRLNWILYKQRNTLQKAVEKAIEELNKISATDFAQAPLNVAIAGLQNALAFVKEREKDNAA